MWLSTTCRLSREFDGALYSIYEEDAVKLKDVKGFAAKLTSQLLPRTTASQDRSGGYLALASDSNDRLLVFINLGWSYQLESDAQIVQDTAIECLRRVEAKAKQLRVWHPFKYLNYADE